MDHQAELHYAVTGNALSSTPSEIKGLTLSTSPHQVLESIPTVTLFAGSVATKLPRTVLESPHVRLFNAGQMWFAYSAFSREQGKRNILKWVLNEKHTENSTLKISTKECPIENTAVSPSSPSQYLPLSNIVDVMVFDDKEHIGGGMPILSVLDDNGTFAAWSLNPSNEPYSIHGEVTNAHFFKCHPTTCNIWALVGNNSVSFALYQSKERHLHHTISGNGARIIDGCFIDFGTNFAILVESHGNYSIRLITVPRKSKDDSIQERLLLDLSTLDTLSSDGNRYIPRSICGFRNEVVVSASMENNNNLEIPVALLAWKLRNGYATTPTPLIPDQSVIFKLPKCQIENSQFSISNLNHSKDFGLQAASDGTLSVLAMYHSEASQVPIFTTTGKSPLPLSHVLFADVGSPPLSLALSLSPDEVPGQPHPDPVVCVRLTCFQATNAVVSSTSTFDICRHSIALNEVLPLNAPPPTPLEVGPATANIINSLKATLGLGLGFGSGNNNIDNNNNEDPSSGGVSVPYMGLNEDNNHDSIIGSAVNRFGILDDTPFSPVGTGGTSPPAKMSPTHNPNPNLIPIPIPSPISNPNPNPNPISHDEFGLGLGMGLGLLPTANPNPNPNPILQPEKVAAEEVTLTAPVASVPVVSSSVPLRDDDDDDDDLGASLYFMKNPATAIATPPATVATSAATVATPATNIGSEVKGNISAKTKPKATPNVPQVGQVSSEGQTVPAVVPAVPNPSKRKSPSGKGVRSPIQSPKRHETAASQTHTHTHHAPSASVTQSVDFADFLTPIAPMTPFAQIARGLSPPRLTGYESQTDNGDYSYAESAVAASSGGSGTPPSGPPSDGPTSLTHSMKVYSDSKHTGKFDGKKIAATIATSAANSAANSANNAATIATNAATIATNAATSAATSANNAATAANNAAKTVDINKPDESNNNTNINIISSTGVEEDLFDSALQGVLSDSYLGVPRTYINDLRVHHNLPRSGVVYLWGLDPDCTAEGVREVISGEDPLARVYVDMEPTNPNPNPNNPNPNPTNPSNPKCTGFGYIILDNPSNQNEVFMRRKALVLAVYLNFNRILGPTSFCLANEPFADNPYVRVEGSQVVNRLAQGESVSMEEHELVEPPTLEELTEHEKSRYYNNNNINNNNINNNINNKKSVDLNSLVGSGHLRFKSPMAPPAGGASGSSTGTVTSNEAKRPISVPSVNPINAIDVKTNTVNMQHIATAASIATGNAATSAATSATSAASAAMAANLVPSKSIKAKNKAATAATNAANSAANSAATSATGAATAANTSAKNPTSSAKVPKAPTPGKTAATAATSANSVATKPATVATGGNNNIPAAPAPIAATSAATNAATSATSATSAAKVAGIANPNPNPSEGVPYDASHLVVSLLRDGRVDEAIELVCYRSNIRGVISVVQMILDSNPRSFRTQVTDGTFLKLVGVLTADMVYNPSLEGFHDRTRMLMELLPMKIHLFSRFVDTRGGSGGSSNPNTTTSTNPNANPNANPNIDYLKKIAVAEISSMLRRVKDMILEQLQQIHSSGGGSTSTSISGGSDLENKIHSLEDAFGRIMMLIANFE